MTRPTFLSSPRLCLLATLVVLSGAAIAPPTRAETAKKPNFVFLLVDDLRWNALGYMGDPVVKTPNIDRLARKGIVFSNAFVTTSICWASRATIFTGQWMRRHRVGMDRDRDLQPGGWEQSYPLLLRANGYRTGFIGKFGVGGAKEIAAHESQFDYWKGLPGQAGEMFEPNDPTHTHKTARFGNEALEFLEGCDAQKPFCLSLSFNAVHARDHKPREYPPDSRDEGMYDGYQMPVPKLATEEAFNRLPPFVQKSEGRTRWGWRFDTPEKFQSILRDYYALISGVDREVGRILDTLEKKGLASNTVVFFTGDNGYALGDRGMADKWYMWEEDLRVPLIIFDPRLPAERQGTKVSAMTLNVDFAPTMLAMADAPVPPVMQGRSLAPLLKGAVPADWRTEFFYEHHSVADRIPPSEGVRTERYKYIRWMPPNPLVEEFYDLQSDPLEENNLINDPAQSDRIAELKTKWERYAKSLE